MSAYLETRRQLKLFAACERRGSMQARNAIFDGALNQSPMSMLLLALLMGDEDQSKLSAESLSITDCQLANWQRSASVLGCDAGL